MPEDTVGAVVPAAGLGQRLGGVNKAFAELAGQPLVAWSVDVLQGCPEVDRVALVLQEASVEEGRLLAARRGWSKVLVCAGGSRRQDSALRGLELLRPCSWIIVHDGARPLLDGAMVRRGLEAARQWGAAVAAVPVKDTIKEAGADALVVRTPDRSRLWAAQTPQVFRRDVLESAYRLAGSQEATDDASLVERAGGRVAIFAGEEWNIKVTTPGDLLLAGLFLKERQRAKVS